MGVAVSTQSPLAPVSLASSVVGFAGFAFTVATAIGVFWSNLQTFAAAPTEIHDSLSNLRQSLYEERAHLRKARRHGRRRRSSASARAGKGATGVKEKENDVGPDAALQAMVTAVKHMIVRVLRRISTACGSPSARQNSSSSSVLFSKTSLHVQRGGRKMAGRTTRTARVTVAV